jgi:hypothetical protein
MVGACSAWRRRSASQSGKYERDRSFGIDTSRGASAGVDEDSTVAHLRVAAATVRG